jgi:hypothetical protein
LDENKNKNKNKMLVDESLWTVIDIVRCCMEVDKRWTSEVGRRADVLALQRWQHYSSWCYNDGDAAMLQLATLCCNDGCVAALQLPTLRYGVATMAVL